MTTDPRLQPLAAKLDAGLIARREFLRRAAVIVPVIVVGCTSQWKKYSPSGSASTA